MVLNSKEEEWILKQLPQKTIGATLLFSDKVDGWRKQKWWQKVKSKGPTLTLIKSKGGKISAGYTESKWDNIAFSNDPASFLLSISHKMKYLPIDPECAVYMSENEGPNFGLGALYVAEGDKLNGDGQSRCNDETDVYRIPVDEDGKNLLTGEKVSFTCIALETYSIQY